MSTESMIALVAVVSGLIELITMLSIGIWVVANIRGTTKELTAAVNGLHEWLEKVEQRVWDHSEDIAEIKGQGVRRRQREQ